MKASQMKYEFLVGYDKIASSRASGYNDKEISTMLTEAQSDEIKEILSIYGQKYVKGFDIDAKVTRYLDELVANNSTVVFNTIFGTIDNKENGVFVPLPDNHFYSLQEEIISNIKKSDCSTVDTIADFVNDDISDSELKHIPVKPVTYDEYNNNITNPFKKPYRDLVWRMSYNTNKYELITDGTYMIYKYILRYLRKPEPIIVPSTQYNATDEIDGFVYSSYSTSGKDCQLHDSFHRNIIGRAITGAAAKNLDSNAYQILNIDNMKQE